MDWEPEVTRLLTKHICREDREQTKILVAYIDSMVGHMEQQLGASESCNDKSEMIVDATRNRRD